MQPNIEIKGIVGPMVAFAVTEKCGGIKLTGHEASTVPHLRVMLVEFVSQAAPDKVLLGAVFHCN